MNLMKALFVCILSCMFQSQDYRPELEMVMKYQCNTDVSEVCEDTPLITFVGDSRTVGMQMNCPDGLYICKCGEGYRWLVSEETSQSVNQAARSSDIFVFNLGVNDLHNVCLYADYIREFTEKYPGAMVAYMSVNPIDNQKAKEHGYRVTDEQAVAFNEKLRELLPQGVLWINTHDFLMEGGYETSDGIHYTAETYEDIYSYTINQITQ